MVAPQSEPRAKAQTGSLSHPGGVSKAGYQQGRRSQQSTASLFLDSTVSFILEDSLKSCHCLGSRVVEVAPACLPLSLPIIPPPPIVPETLCVSTKPCRLSLPVIQSLR